MPEFCAMWVKTLMHPMYASTTHTHRHTYLPPMPLLVSAAHECHPQQLVSESKFLQPHALLELVKTLTFASRGADDHVALGTAFSEQTAVFFLELFIAVAMDNK